MIKKTAAISAGAGSGHRLGADLPKALVKLIDKTLVEHAVNALTPVAQLIVVTAPAGFEDKFKEILGDQVKVITGGVLRSDSIRIALNEIGNEYEFVLVHDAARAIASTQSKRLMQMVMFEIHQSAQIFAPYKRHRDFQNLCSPTHMHPLKMQLMMRHWLKQLE
jgi:2-C-methyl-D-erythritol 4-phosphate cytidylyltransferase